MANMELRLRNWFGEELATGLAGVRIDVRAELRDQRTLMFALFGANTATVAVAMAIVGFA